MLAVGRAGALAAEETGLTRRDAWLPHRQDACATVSAASLVFL